MGCCTSIPEDEENHDPSSSSPPIAPPLSEQQQQQQRTPNPVPVPPSSTRSSRPNRPLLTPSPLPTSPSNVSRHPPPWTRAHLASERAAFFDTRVTGRAEVWAAIRLVCDLLRQDAVADAQAVLDAADLNCPTGRVETTKGNKRSREAGIWDSRGWRYEVPAWVVVDPGDLVEEDGGIGDRGERRGDMREGEREGEGEEVVVGVRRSDGGRDLEVKVRRNEGVRAVLGRVRDEVGSGRKVKLVYLGRVLDESRSLGEQGWQAGHVVNAMLLDGD